MADEKQITVKFSQTVTTQDAEGKTFEKDSTHTLPESSARHWINRKAATVVNDDDKGLEAQADEHTRLLGTPPGVGPDTVTSDSPTNALRTVPEAETRTTARRGKRR